MSILITCPNCDRGIKAKDSYLGRTVNCPACSKPFKVQSPSVPSSDDSSEHTLWSGRPSQIVNIGSYCALFFMALILLGVAASTPEARFWSIILLLAVAAYAAWKHLTIHCQTYDLTTERLRIHRGVLSKRIDDLELYRVKDTVFEQSVFLRLFARATVTVHTSDVSSKEVQLFALPASSARDLRELIRKHTERLRDKKRVREVDWT